MVFGLGKSVDQNVSMGDNVKIINKKGVREFQSDYYCIKDGIVVVEKNAVIPSGTII